MNFFLGEGVRVTVNFWDQFIDRVFNGLNFGLLLALKIGLALSVFGHFLAAMWWRRRGVLGGRRSHRLHLSVFCHVLAIVLLAKAMFYLHW